MKTCVVTGATSGIGLAVAEELARRGHRVVLLSRDPGRGEAALARVRAAAGSALPSGPEPLVVAGELSTVTAARAAAAALLQACPRLDVLVHNAGLWPTRLERTAEGFERAFAVNHLAPFVLNELLVPRLLESAPSRIVQVTAGLYGLGRLDLDRTPRGEDFHRLRTYATTKLWNLLATLERARRLAASGVVVHAVHPGVVRTRLGDLPGALGLLLRGVKRLWATPEHGARGPVHLALAPELEGRTGLYFDELAERELLPVARDPKLAAELCERTARLVAGIG